MADAGGDNHILLTTDHPRSMRTLAWTRTFRHSRVFCLQPGDGERACGVTSGSARCWRRASTGACRRAAERSMRKRSRRASPC